MSSSLLSMPNPLSRPFAKKRCHRGNPWGFVVTATEKLPRYALPNRVYAAKKKRYTGVPVELPCLEVRRRRMSSNRRRVSVALSPISGSWNQRPSSSHTSIARLPGCVSSKPPGPISWPDQRSRRRRGHVVAGIAAPPPASAGRRLHPR